MLNIQSPYKAIKKWRYVRQFLRAEFTGSLRASAIDHWRALGSGFLTSSYQLYNLDENPPGNYLSDWSRYTRTPFINGPFGIVLDNKLIFRDAIGHQDELFPRHFALMRGKEVIALDPEYPMKNFSDVISKVKSEGTAVIKPLLLGGGEGVKIIHYNGSFQVNGKTVPKENLGKAIKFKGAQLFIEFIKQASYAQKIYPESTNTIRILTLWDIDLHKPFVAAAVHRFGTSHSAPVDNVTQGGLSVLIDHENGILREAVKMDPRKPNQYFTSHPESGEQITGIPIPNWQSVYTKILGHASRFPHIPNIGWDVVITDSGFKILEGNNFSDVHLLQVHQPLLADPRVRKFYEHHNIL